MRKIATLSYWYNVYDKTQHGYSLIDYYDEGIIYFEGSYNECRKYAKKNNIIAIDE